MYLHFTTFSDNLLILSHSLILRSFPFTKDYKFWSCMLSLNMFSVLDRVVSSALMRKLNIFVA